MIDPKDVVIEDLYRTLAKLESTLRHAGNIQFKEYHNHRDKQLAQEFIKMADAARESMDFAVSTILFE
jgi:hypothetical protein